jgi:hypothetical protein
MSEQKEALRATVHAHLREGRLPCEDAFFIVQECGVRPDRLSEFVNEVGVRIGWCQLGLFAGGKKEKTSVASSPVPVRPELRVAIEAALEEGLLPCARAWGIAKRLGIERIEVGRAADRMNVQISRCQLGCFP